MRFAHAGEILSIAAALVWSLSVVLFRVSGRRMAPLSLNFFKNIVAVVLLLVTFPILGQRLLIHAPAADYVILAASGVLGITIADTLFFKSLNLVGAGLSQLVSLAYSPIVILFSFAFLGERLTPGDAAGACLIVFGIFLASGHEPPHGVTRADIRKGIGIATASVALMALGIVIAKPVLDRSPVLWASTVRLVAGVIVLALGALVSPKHRYLWSSLKPSSSWKVAVPAAFLGAYVSMVIWIAGMKYTQASIAAILNQTSAVFVLPFAAVILKERVTVRKLGAVALAIGGAVLVTLV
jgi:drug/metabolite transporter (DMT)-like permease